MGGMVKSASVRGTLSWPPRISLLGRGEDMASLWQEIIWQKDGLSDANLHIPTHLARSVVNSKSMNTTNLSPQNGPHDEAQLDAAIDTDDAKFVANMRYWAVIGLVIVGVGLVMIANTLGVALVKGPYGTWNPNDATQAALTIRTLGIMAFAGGLVERMLLCWEKLARPRMSIEEESPRA